MAASSRANDFPDACQVRSSLGWPTRSVEHHTKSHIATENFYTGRSTCVLPYKIGDRQTADPTEFLPIFFESVSY